MGGGGGGGGAVSTKGRDGTNFPHCIILSYWCWLYLVFMLLLVVLAVIL